MDNINEPSQKRRKYEDSLGVPPAPPDMDFTVDATGTSDNFTIEDKYSNFATPEEVEKLKEFKVLDEIKSNDEESNDEDSRSSDGENEVLPLDELEKMLDEDLPEGFKGSPKQKEKSYVTRTKIVLEEKGINNFEILPLDWMMVRHCSGIPLYMHRGTRVCTLSKPYFLGTGNTRRHDIPISSIPCLAYKRALEEEAKQKEIDRKIEQHIKNRVSNKNDENNVIPKKNITNERPNNNVMIRNIIKKEITEDIKCDQISDINNEDIKSYKSSDQGASSPASVASIIEKSTESSVVLPQRDDNFIADNNSINLNERKCPINIINNHEDTTSINNDDIVSKEKNKSVEPGSQIVPSQLSYSPNELNLKIKQCPMGFNNTIKDTTPINEDASNENDDKNSAVSNNEATSNNTINQNSLTGVNQVSKDVENNHSAAKDDTQVGEISSVVENNETTEQSEIPFNQQPVILPGGVVMPPPRVESVNTSWKTQHLTPEQINDYCKKLFIFKSVNIMHFQRWADRRKYTKARKRLQCPTLPEGTKLVTIPVTNSGQEIGGRPAKRDWVMNMNGRSYLSVFHEYAHRALQKQPIYEFKQLENASMPYQATVFIDGMQYGVGLGSSKRQAKSAAARASIHILIPEMKEHLEPDNNSDPDFTFFDYVGIEDPRIPELCTTACEPSPHAILRTCLLRNFGAADWNIHTEMKKLEFQKIELTMTVGKHKATVVCKNKKTAKQRAAQSILQALHPHVRSWGSLLRLYGSRSVKSCKEKKLEEQQITLLQDKARHNEPNYAVLEKLRNEMIKLRERDAAVVPIGTLLLSHALPSNSASNLNSVDF